MGQAKLKRTTTEKFIKAHPVCCYCGAPSTTRDHVPATSFFRKLQRPDNLVVPSCTPCNLLTSRSELVCAIIARLGFGNPDEADEQDFNRLIPRLRKEAPEVIQEWVSLPEKERRATASDLRAKGIPLPEAYEMAKLGPRTFPYVHLFTRKIGLAIYYGQFGYPLSPDGGVFAAYFPKEHVALSGLPPAALRFLGPVKTLEQGEWKLDDQFQYRVAMDSTGNALSYLARLRNGFFVWGGVIANLSAIPQTKRLGFVKPGDLSSILDDPLFVEPRVGNAKAA